MNKTRRAYDHRLKLAIVRSGNINLFPGLNIPKTTARNWIHRGIGDVVSLDVFDLPREELEQKCLQLENRVRVLESQFELLKYVSRIMGLGVQYQRLKAEIKKKMIDAIEVAKIIVPQEDCLEIIGLSRQRFSNWISRMKSCQLADFSTCPKIHKTQLTPAEISAIKKLVENPEFSHYSLTSLWYFARNTGRVIVSSSSWFRTIQNLKLTREHRKKYFYKPKKGLRALEPNQIWHVDVSVLRFNGIKAYVQAIRDNFSRLVLAYEVSESYGGEKTKALVETAIKRAQEFGYFDMPTLMSDKGSENVNSWISNLDSKNIIRHVLAQIDIIYSNSMVESFFHQLKNRHLYFKDIHTMDALKGHIEYYVRDQNEVIPFLALNGATAQEAYKDKSAVTTDKANAKKLVQSARQGRIDYYQSLKCSSC